MTKIEFKFKNGEEVKDLVTGLIGIIDCSSMWLNGCKRYSVQPRIQGDETKRPNAIWMDEEQLEFVSAGISKKVKPTETGGPSFSSEDARNR